MVFLGVERALGHKEREVGVLHAQRLDPGVKEARDGLPDGEAVRPQDVAACMRRAWQRSAAVVRLRRESSGCRSSGACLSPRRAWGREALAAGKEACGGT